MSEEGKMGGEEAGRERAGPSVGVGREGPAAPGPEKRGMEGMREDYEGGGEGSGGATLFREVQEKDGTTYVVARWAECHSSFARDRRVPVMPIEMVARSR